MNKSNKNLIEISRIRKQREELGQQDKSKDFLLKSNPRDFCPNYLNKAWGLHLIPPMYFRIWMSFHYIYLFYFLKTNA